MREFERIERIINLLTQLWKYNYNLPLGELLEKRIWTDWIETLGDVFHCEDRQTEERLNQAIFDAQSVSTSSGELGKDQLAIIQKIQEFWPKVPDQRLGQFLSNYAFGHFLSNPPKMLLRQSDETILATLEQL